MGPHRRDGDLWLCWRCMAQPSATAVPCDGSASPTPCQPLGLGAREWTRSGRELGLDGTAASWVAAPAGGRWRSFFLPVPSPLCLALTWQSTWGDYVGYLHDGTGGTLRIGGVLSAARAETGEFWSKQQYVCRLFAVVLIPLTVESWLSRRSHTPVSERLLARAWQPASVKLRPADISTSNVELCGVNYGSLG